MTVVLSLFHTLSLSTWLSLVVFTPLATAMVGGFGQIFLGHKWAQMLTTLGITLCAIVSAYLFYQVGFGHQTSVQTLLPWIVSGDFSASWGLRLDTLTAVMLVVVCTVSAVVHWYSLGYMHTDSSRGRFMAYLSFFTFAMLMLVTADNLLQMFFGWEGVGVASYLLIGFYNKKDSANKAAIKAFVVNRVGDFGYVLGIIMVWQIFGSLDFSVIAEKSAYFAPAYFNIFGLTLPALNTCALLLFVGAMGKSAQLGLHTWLPDAMEGPTPVSALIHAATMVTAGVFMVARLNPLFEHAPFALDVITVLGALTAFVAATIALTQNDIKRVIAYSTMSQLGYMFFALGVSAYGAAIFHLMTHAFFKALLFLSAGSVIHALHHEQDLRRMGGLWRKLPITYAMMWVGSLALAGVPFLAGYYSKDTILEAVYAANRPAATLAFALGIAGAFLTAFYSFRLIFMAFHGKTKLAKKDFDHAHEAPATMWVPLLVLVAGAIGAGFLAKDWFVGANRHAFWGAALKLPANHDVLDKIHHVPHWVPLLPTIVGLLGIALAVVLYVWRTTWPAKIAKALPKLYSLSQHKWFFDEAYEATLQKPSIALGKVFWIKGDQNIIDRFGPNGITTLAVKLAEKLKRLQTGFIYHYATMMLFGVVVILFYILWRFYHAA